MAYLFDTNIFLRLANKADPAHTLAVEALRALRRRREMLCFTPQVLAEFWSVCTRPPSARGGFGLPPAEAERRARVIERYFRLLPDSAATYHEWRQLLLRHTVSGVQVHDARLIASMKVYGITHLLTFNAEDFTRYPDITVVDPQHVRQA
jgi:predicted nucleic acid-binding protein